MPKTTAAGRRPFLLLGLLSIIFWLTAFSPPQDTPEFKLIVNKRFGYNNGNQIRGRFRLKAVGPVDLVVVTFKVDESVIGVVETAPFEIEFTTDDYPPGQHVLWAEGQTAAGQTLTASRRFDFVTPAQSQADMVRLIGPMLGVIGAIMLIVVGSQLAGTFRRRRSPLPPDAPRRYGLKGGAICPHCGRPFSLHLLGLNLLTRTYDYCDHCGRWSLHRRATPQELAAAEAAELHSPRAEAHPTPPPAEKIRRALDDSRFLDDR